VLLVADHGPDARDALFEVVARLRAPDPLTPVTVVVPSPLAGVALRRAAGRRSGFANVRFTELARMAELLGAPQLAAAGRRPLTPPVRREAIHAALAADDGPFAGVAGHPATSEALAATFDELRTLPPAQLDALGRRSGRAGAVVRLFRASQALTADCYDTADVVRAAATAVRDDAPGAAEVGHVVVHLPATLEPAEEALLRALGERHRLTMLLGRTGDAAVDAAGADALAARFADVLGPPAGRPGVRPDAALPRAHRVVSAPDPEDEVRAITRELHERARAGAPLGRVAILFRIGEPYARLVPEVLDAAGIPWTGAAPHRLADSIAGRVLLGLLALADHDLARDEVAGWLACGPIVDPASGRRVNAARWDVLSREAGVVRGAAQWSERLALHRAAIADELTRLQAELEASEWQLERLARTRDEAGALDAFVVGLAESLTLPLELTWAAHVSWAGRLLTRYAGDGHHRDGWPEREVEAAHRVAAVLDELGRLDAMGSPVDLARFRRALASELDAPQERVGRFGEGVLVAPLHQGYAGDFDTVYVIGAVEGSLPPRGREDPLLPEHDRRGLSGLMPHAVRRLEERRDYLTALAAAAERVLVFPRADGRIQRKRLPAQWVLESARALGGTDLTAELLRDHASASWLDVIDSFEGLVAQPGPASPTEYRLRAFGAWRDSGREIDDHPLAPLAPGNVDRGFVAARQRGGAGATAFDGFVGHRPELTPGTTRPTSPTALQDWASCPFRYFLGRVLRLHDVPRPEATEAISALDEGALIHDVLEEFVRDSLPLDGPDARWTADDRARLDALVRARCDDAEARGVTGRKVAWILARRRIIATAHRFLDVDEHVRASFGVVPAPDGLERAFGDDAHTPVAVRLRDGRSVRFRGRIDRVDRTPAGDRAVVYDYKTGNPRRYAASGDDPVAGGRALQLPVYALAARAQEGVDEAIACYWFTRESADRALLEVGLDDAEARFVDVVGTIVDGVSSGCFPAYPGDRTWDPVAGREGWECCRYCDFDRLCPVDRGSAWDRVAEDPAAAAFHALDLPDDVEDDAEDAEEGAEGSA
jgi:hypothetical protein